MNEDLSEPLPSLRSSERGLKYTLTCTIISIKPSLRSSERGLKSDISTVVVSTKLSLRSSERGLKFIFHRGLEWLYAVAPFVGAWIEI